MADINPILAAAQNFQTQARGAATQIYQNSAAEAEMESQNSETILNQGINEAIIAVAKGSSELAIQQARLKAATAFGTNLTESTEKITELSQALELTRQEQAVHRAAINEKRSVGLTDDPVQWLMNQFTINDDINKYNSSERTGDDLARRIQEANLLTQQSVATQNALGTSVSSATIDAEANKALNLATINANLAKIRGSQYNSQGISAALNATRDALSTQFQVANAENAEQQIKISLDHLDMARKENLRKLEKENLDDSIVMQAINAGMKIRLGADTPDLTPQDAKMAMAMAKSGKPNQFSQDFQVGLEFLSTGVKRYASSPAESLALLGSNIRMNLPPAANEVKAILETAMTQVKAGTDGKPFDPKDVQGNITALNTRANAILAQASKKIVPGTDNPFNVPSLPTLIKASPNIATLPVVEKVYTPLLKNGVDLTSPAKQFAAVVDALEKNEISYEEALSGAALYQYAVRVNLEARQFTAFGFQPPGDGSWFKYNVEIETKPGATFGSKSVVNLTDEQAYARALNQALAAKNNLFKQPNTIGIYR